MVKHSNKSSKDDNDNKAKSDSSYGRLIYTNDSVLQREPSGQRGVVDITQRTTTPPEPGAGKNTGK